MRQKTCKSCKERFTPERQMQVVCSPKCAAEFSATNRQREITRRESVERQEAREKRKRLMTITQLKKTVQRDFNAYIRARDEGLPCISCGRIHDGQWHAGHYLTTAAHPELRFDARNCHRQCQPCNHHLSGNLVGYRKGLIERYGQHTVDWLEGPHEPNHHTREELINMAAWWRRVARSLRKDSQSRKSKKTQEHNP